MTEPTKNASSAQSHRRRIVYVDQAIQNRLLVALVILEVVLVVGSLMVLYVRMSGIIEANLYRTHVPVGYSVLGDFVGELGYVMVGMVVANLIALLVADRVWAAYVGGVVTRFRELMVRTASLDLSSDEASSSRHEVLDLASRWRRSEADRCGRLSDMLNLMQAHAENPDAKRYDWLRSDIGELHKALTGPWYHGSDTKDPKN